MADWKKLASAALLADGKIDDTEVKLLKRELFADNKIDDEEMEFLIALRKSAASKAKAAKATVNPNFEKLFHAAVEKHVLSGDKVDAAKTKKLEALLGKPSPGSKKFLSGLKKKATGGGAEFNALAEKHGAK
jgi:hypothetical protein